jgi:hypothetical protein
MIDEKALEAGARAVLHRRIKPDFFEVKDGVWTLDHDKVIAEAAITAYLQALRPGSTGESDGWVLVPKVPSEQMVEAGFDALEASLPTYRETGRDCHPYDLDCRDWDTCSRKEDIGLIVYRAMLAAAGGTE